MNDATYQRFRELIQRTSGIALGAEKGNLLSGRIRQRMKVLGLDSPDEYYNSVRRDDHEIVHLLDAISTNHTFFFRESDHFSVLRELVIQRLAAGQRRFRIWCAAASSGEEPYSLAMSMLDLFDERSAVVDFKILATDISTKVLNLAQAGWYSKERCECLPQQLKAKYLEPAHQNRIAGYSIRPRLRDIVLFRRLNLIEFPYPQRGPLDAIFCRNVMIYFDEPTRRSIVANMLRLLPDHGLLFVGMTESILGIHNGYEFVHPSVYRKCSTSS